MLQQKVEVKVTLTQDLEPHIEEDYVVVVKCIKQTITQIMHGRNSRVNARLDVRLELGRVIGHLVGFF